MSYAFKPVSGGTVNIDVSSSSQRVQVYAERGPITIRIMNNGTATVWLNYGDSSATATTTAGFPVGPGVTEALTIDNVGSGPLYIAAIAAGATGKIYFTPGRGI